MNDHKFDEIARLLASPIPRRQVFRRVIGGLAAAALAAIGSPPQALAGVSCATNADCSAGQFCCNASICCPDADVCCGLGANSICCPNNQVCCGGAHTPAVCCAVGELCYNNQCVTNVSPH